MKSAFQVVVAVAAMGGVACAPSEKAEDVAAAINPDSYNCIYDSGASNPNTWCATNFGDLPGVPQNGFWCATQSNSVYEKGDCVCNTHLDGALHDACQSFIGDDEGGRGETAAICSDPNKDANNLQGECYATSQCESMYETERFGLFGPHQVNCHRGGGSICYCGDGAGPGAPAGGARPCFDYVCSGHSGGGGGGGGGGTGGFDDCENQPSPTQYCRDRYAHIESPEQISCAQTSWNVQDNWPYDTGDCVCNLNNNSSADDIACKALDGDDVVPSTDYLLSLHYDNAPDKDDVQSAAADRTMIEATLGCGWAKEHVIIVNGTYTPCIGGRTSDVAPGGVTCNSNAFQSASDSRMQAIWSGCHRGSIFTLWPSQDRTPVVASIRNEWQAVLSRGGQVDVKEGGQSGTTWEVLQPLSGGDLKRVTVVQHSRYNEALTRKSELDAVSAWTTYRGPNTVPDGNQDDVMRIENETPRGDGQGGCGGYGHNARIAVFRSAAESSARFGDEWRQAFAYYDPYGGPGFPNGCGGVDYSDSIETADILYRRFDAQLLNPFTVKTETFRQSFF